MIIGGFQKQSLVDYPGKISSIIFIFGCNFRCPFCHNPELVLPEKVSKKEISKTFVMEYLKKNKKFIDAVVITGGEPTLNKDLPSLISGIKELGYLIKVDTNGTNPEMIKKLIDKKMVDYIALDIKSPIIFEKYREITGNKLKKKDLENIEKSIELILNSGIEHEFRTTVATQYIKENIGKIAKKIKGANRFCIQRFIPSKIIDDSYYGLQSFDKKEFKEDIENIKKFVKEVVHRD